MISKGYATHGPAFLSKAGKTASGRSATVSRVLGLSGALLGAISSSAWPLLLSPPHQTANMPHTHNWGSNGRRRRLAVRPWVSRRLRWRKILQQASLCPSCQLDALRLAGVSDSDAAVNLASGPCPVPADIPRCGAVRPAPPTPGWSLTRLRLYWNPNFLSQKFLF